MYLKVVLQHIISMDNLPLGKELSCIKIMNEVNYGINKLYFIYNAKIRTISFHFIFVATYTFVIFYK